MRPSNPDYVRNAGNQIASALKDGKIAR